MPQYPHLIDKPRFNAPTDKFDAFYDPRNRTLLLLAGGHRITLTESQAWDLLSRIEQELHAADYDRKDD